MQPRNLRELIIEMTAGHGGAYNKTATIGQVLQVAKMILKEIDDIRDLLLSSDKKE